MAKQRTQLNDFFEGRRRRCRLDDYRTLKDEKDHVCFKLIISSPLTGEPAHGIHDQFAEPMMVMAKQKSECNNSKVNVIVKSASVAIFSTDTISSAVAKTTGASLQDFSLSAIGIDDRRIVSLHFNAYLPFVESLKQWVLDNLHKDFFMEAVPSQMEIADPKDPPPNKKKKPTQANLLVN